MAAELHVELHQQAVQLGDPAHLHGVDVLQAIDLDDHRRLGLDLGELYLAFRLLQLLCEVADCHPALPLRALGNAGRHRRECLQQLAHVLGGQAGMREMAAVAAERQAGDAAVQRVHEHHRQLGQGEALAAFVECLGDPHLDAFLVAGLAGGFSGGFSFFLLLFGQAVGQAHGVIPCWRRPAASAGTGSWVRRSEGRGAGAGSRSACPGRRCNRPRR